MAAAAQTARKPSQQPIWNMEPQSTKLAAHHRHHRRENPGRVWPGRSAATGPSGANPERRLTPYRTQPRRLALAVSTRRQTSSFSSQSWGTSIGLDHGGWVGKSIILRGGSRYVDVRRATAHSRYAERRWRGLKALAQLPALSAGTTGDPYPECGRRGVADLEQQAAGFTEGERA